MNKTLISVALATAFFTSAAYAAPVGAFSELELSHSFVVNGGSVPTGIAIINSGASFEFDADATSEVDNPAANSSQTNFVQIGNPFVDPPLPFISQRNNATRLPGGFEGAASGFDIEVTTQDDPSEDVFGTVGRGITQSGAASAILLDDTDSASATSFVRLARNLIFTNTTDELISFNIAGEFNAMLRAEYTGNDGLARVAGGFELDFVGINGAAVNYFPVSPYLTTIQNSDPGTNVNHSLQTDTGVNFDASASAIGDGGTTLASFEGAHRYVFTLTLDPFAQILMRTSFTQANSVEHTPIPTIEPVPLPAGGVLLITGVFGFAAMHRRAKRASGVA